MARHGLEGRSGRLRRHNLTRQAKVARQVPDLLERDFNAERPDLKWVSDISYVPTAQGWLYLLVALVTHLWVGHKSRNWSRSCAIVAAATIDGTTPGDCGTTPQPNHRLPAPVTCPEVGRRLGKVTAGRRWWPAGLSVVMLWLVGGGSAGRPVLSATVSDVGGVGFGVAERAWGGHGGWPGG
jgi:hypothetical protein